MNFDLPFIPSRTIKPRDSGVTMMMDKGLSLTEAKNFIEASGDYTDLVKFGFGTAYVTVNLQKKIDTKISNYQSHIESLSKQYKEKL